MWKCLPAWIIWSSDLVLLSQEALLGGLSLLMLSLTFPINSRTLSEHFSCYCWPFLKCSCSDGANCIGKIKFYELFFFLCIISVSGTSAQAVLTWQLCAGTTLAGAEQILGVRATLRSLPCAGEPEESLGSGQTHSRASRARLQSQSTAAQEISLPVSLSLPLKFLCSSWFKNWETLSNVV